MVDGTRCGFVAILGRPNVGKSTLLNSLVGAKVAGVSDKVQTTRNRILGVWMEDQTQLLFLDTPGLHKTEGRPRINKKMMQEAWQTLGDADHILFLSDAQNPMNEVDCEFLKATVEKTSKPVQLLLTKSDKLKKAEHEAIEERVRHLIFKDFADYGQIELGNSLMFSAKSPTDVSDMRGHLAQLMPEGPWLFDPENLTDRTQKFIVGEYVREQIFRLCGDEIPYSAGVVVDLIDFHSEPVHIMATIYVERDTHKSMIIGKGGQKIKKIGQNSRQTIETLLDQRVYLELFVKVKDKWSDQEQWIREIAGLEE